MTEKKTLYINKDDAKALTEAVVQYNKENQPIKIFNECFDYYVETYNIKPIYCREWYNIIDIRKSFEYRKVDKSINKSKSNNKSKKIRDFDYIKTQRYLEVDDYINSVKNWNPEKGKLKYIELPMIIWHNMDKIARNLVQNYRFYGYTYKDDLVMSAMEKCIKYIGNFSIYSSDNAFSFFTSTIYNSFRETLKKEYNYSNIKQEINTKFYDASTDEQNIMQESYNGCA